jgi:hypothetical protein
VARTMPFWGLLGVFLMVTVGLTSEPCVWVAPSLQRISRTSPPGQVTEARLRAARREYESFQIVIHAPKGSPIKNVNVSVTDLRGPGRMLIGKPNITLYREKYVEVRIGSPDRGGVNRPRGPGVYPDGLIPFIDPQTGQRPRGGRLAAAPFDVHSGENEVIWVDVFVPPDVGAGRYTGAYIVTSDQGGFRGDIAVDVWDFSLPLQPSLNSNFLVWSHDRIPVIKELLRHKLNAGKIPSEQQRDLLKGFGLRSTDLGFWSGADISNCVMSPPPSATQLREALAKQAPGLFLYNYTADEVDRCPALEQRLREWGRALHRAGVKNLVTMAPTKALLDDGSGNGQSAVDIWAMLPVTYDRSIALVRQAREKGNEIWSYNALVQDSYSPKWLIDFDPVNFRIQPGFLSQVLGLTGLLYWRVDLWSSDPWSDVSTAQFKKYPGEGMLVYPGADVGISGVAPSMRLKWLRDGVEDYEYLQILKQLGLGEKAMGKAARAARSWSDWTKDPAALEQSRRELGDMLAAVNVPTRVTR